ncbi:tumor necrosis factor alpha-induced protein 3-like [Pristis pectinata]|uniref:tumor necrosis factor alpha-induced protein 3-like n=1 Tax=Pristis pectinata TaxID=685728 RepID=UPI00223D381D|nr:tumor necrosis factor alpha-induced protein 3-like [Pristis pectinata]
MTGHSARRSRLPLSAGGPVSSTAEWVVVFAMSPLPPAVGLSTASALCPSATDQPLNPSLNEFCRWTPGMRPSGLRRIYTVCLSQVRLSLNREISQNKLECESIRDRVTQRARRIAGTASSNPPCGWLTLFHMPRGWSIPRGWGTSVPRGWGLTSGCDVLGWIPEPLRTSPPSRAGSQDAEPGDDSIVSHRCLQSGSVHGRLTPSFPRQSSGRSEREPLREDPGCGTHCGRTPAAGPTAGGPRLREEPRLRDPLRRTPAAGGPRLRDPLREDPGCGSGQPAWNSRKSVGQQLGESGAAAGCDRGRCGEAGRSAGSPCTTCRKLHTHTLQLPSTKPYPAPLRSALERALLDAALRRALHAARTLNWCPELRMQHPLRVSGEGNNLLHSVSLYMWGVQDTDRVLQKTFHEALVNAHNVTFKLRLQTEYQRVQGLPDPTPLPQSELQQIWDQEWQNVIESADPDSAAGQAVTNMYQDVHLFVLANVIRRPIIVIVGNSEESSKSTSSVMTSSPAGIYLPLLWPPLQCYSCPILLGYEHRHFSPLITINDIGPEINAFPLVVPSKAGSVELPIRFLLDAEKVNRKQLLSNYLIEISVLDCNGVEFVNAARLLINPLPDDLNLVQDYFQLVNHQYKSRQEGSDDVRSNRNERDFDFLSNLSIVEDKCLTHGCPYFCSKFTKPFCHVCHDAFQSKEGPSEPNICKEEDNHGGNRQLNRKETTIFAVQDIRDHLSPPPTSDTLFFNETNALKCKSTECPFTGSVALHGFCASCFCKRGHVDGIPEGGRNSAPALPGEIVDRRMDLLGERCSKCKQEVRKFNGWCYLCLRRTDPLTLMHGTSGQSSSEPQQAAKTSADSQRAGNAQGQGLQVRQLREGGKCKNPDCQYFGTEDQSGLCTTCFFKYLESLGVSSPQDPARRHSDYSSSPPQKQFAQISSHLRNMSVCRASDCSMLANPAHSGYCEKCYVRAQMKHSHRSHAASCSPADQQVWSHVLPRSSIYKPASNQGASDKARKEPFVLESEGSGHSQNSQSHTLSSSDQLILKPRQHVCRTPGCEHFGNAKCDGYCNACFTSSLM